MKVSWGQAWSLVWAWLLPGLCLWAFFCLWLQLWVSALPVGLIFELAVSGLFSAGALLLLGLGVARWVGWGFARQPWSLPPYLRRSQVVAVLLLLVILPLTFAAREFYVAGVELPADRIVSGLLFSLLCAALSLFAWLLYDSARRAPSTDPRSGLLLGTDWLRGALGQCGSVLLLAALSIGAGYAVDTVGYLTVYGPPLWSLVAWSLKRWLYPSAFFLHSRWSTYWGFVLSIASGTAALMQSLAILMIADPAWLAPGRSLLTILAVLPLLAIFFGTWLCTRFTVLRVAE